MRVGTVLSYDTGNGQSFGVVNELLDVNRVKVNDQNGGEFIVNRGQGHKLEDQQSDFCNGLRQQFGITVGPCQKECFGVEAVQVAKTQYVEMTRQHKPFGIPQRVTVLG